MSDTTMAAYVKEAHVMIDRAAPHIDAGWCGAGWKPSELLRIGFHALLTGRRPERSADFVNDALAVARELFRKGLPANPFATIGQQDGGK